MNFNVVWTLLEPRNTRKMAEYDEQEVQFPWHAVDHEW
jgi:hypothetical protein